MSVQVRSAPRCRVATSPRVRAATVAALLAAISLTASGCAREASPASEVEQLEAAGTGASPSTHAPDAAGSTDPADPPVVPAEPADTAPGRPADTVDPHAVVTEVLDDYASLLTALSADPAGAPPSGSEGQARWHSVVLDTSALSAEVLDRMHRRATVDRVVIVPDQHGTSYRHHVVAARAQAPDVIDFEWCGWSPGIGRSIDTGQVVDDQVAHATGTGRLVRTDHRWRLAALDQWELTLLAPGSPDPCPTTDPGGAP